MSQDEKSAFFAGLSVAEQRPASTAQQGDGDGVPAAPGLWFSNGNHPMIACVQRVSRARVVVEGATIAQIEQGLLVLLGVAENDTAADCERLAAKVAGLRVFDDAQGKMNLGPAEVGGAVLVVSQFTLLGDCRRGRRPDFFAAAKPEVAEPLCQLFCEAVRRAGLPVVAGRFRTHMQVELVNDGPVTLILDTADWKQA